MTDPEAPGGPLGGSSPDDAHAADHDAERVGPPNTAWSLPDGAWRAPDPASDRRDATPAAGDRPDPAPANEQRGAAGDWRPSGATATGWGTPVAGGGWTPAPGGGWTPPGRVAQPARRQAPVPRPRRRLGRVLIAALLIGAAAFLGVAISHDFWQSGDSSSATTLPGGPAASALPFGNGSNGSSSSNSAGVSGSGGATSIAAAVDPALVDINVDLSYQESEAAATGIVLNSTGLVLTNNHVISGATSISAVDVGNGKTYQATVVGYDRSHDIALIQLTGRLRTDERTARRFVEGRDRPARGGPGQRRRHRRHAHGGRRSGGRPEPGDHRQRRGRQHLGAAHRPDPDRCRHPARRLGRTARRQGRPGDRHRHGGVELVHVPLDRQRGLRRAHQHRRRHRRPDHRPQVVGDRAHRPDGVPGRRPRQLGIERGGDRSPASCPAPPRRRWVWPRAT